MFIVDRVNVVFFALGFCVVSTSASDCLERHVSEMTYYVSTGTKLLTHSLTHSLLLVFVGEAPQKAQGSVNSNRIVMKFVRIVLQVNTHLLTESDF